MTTPAAGPIAWSDVPAAAATLTAAFADYALLTAVCPDPVQRPAAVGAFCRMLTRYSARLGHTHATADCLAVGCWLPPGREWLSTPRLIWDGGLSLAWRLGWRGLRQLERYADAFDAARAKHVPEPHWYLNLLGVHPSARGRGLARVVLAPVLAAADHDRRPCYLETQDAVNVGIYRRLGFEVAGETALPGGLHNWEMRRPPG